MAVLHRLLGTRGYLGWVPRTGQRRI